MLGRHGFITWIPRHAVTRLNTGGEGSGVQQIIGRSLCWLIKSAAHNKDYLYFGDLRVHLIFGLRVYYKYTRFWNTNLSTNPMHQNNFQYHKKISALPKKYFLFIVCHQARSQRVFDFFVIDIFYILIWNIANWWRLRFSLSKVAPRGSPIAPILLDWCVTSHRGTTYVWSIQAFT